MVHENNTSTLRKWVVSALVIVALIVVITVILKHRASQEPISRDPSAVATMGQIRERVARLTQSADYKSGGQYLTNVQGSGKGISLNSSDDCYRAIQMGLYNAVNFVRTITPQQVDTMQKRGRLPFSSLNSDQQKLLRLLAKYSISSDELQKTDLQSTFLTVRVYTGDVDRASLEWHYTNTNGRDAMLSVGLQPVPPP